MGFVIDRRRLMQAGSSALAAGALGAFQDRARAESNELTVICDGGDLAKANIAAYCKPFEAATGIKVNAITDQVSMADIELMVSTNSVSIDVFGTNQNSHRVLREKGLLEEIDYSIFKKEELDEIVGFTKHKYGVGATIFSYVMVLSTEKYPPGKPRPVTWADVWDVKKFPGVRSFISGQLGAEGLWEEALLADGVPANAVYPMDIDRVFASLDKIKPHVRKWWANGSEVYQMMKEKGADIVNSYDNRARIAIAEGAPYEINHGQSKLSWTLWAIPKGSPKVRLAQKFIEFATRAERQAAFIKMFPLGTSNLNVFKLIPDALGRSLASHPDYIAKSIPMNADWYGQKGADGVTNAERLRDRWKEWVLL
ncbi:ABC transporter substrate-binding protein [Bradyrhizobium sp. Pear76]|uniref:ABC transporter substrate-binding protein n=1 Tax=Bradyrhizobium oropedii TaxID=1571201 RepID=UPI001E37DBDA|nr:ABC transporter substrate-binding protein [Bradyrhizobium oropedii]MCC8968145.1 ABC transporter substrate-binding protein [Bradyrhizobium oropedii]